MMAATTSARQAPANQLRQYLPTGKEFSTVRARLALHGHTLTEKMRPETGMRIWEVARYGQVHVLGSWHDVCGRLAQLGG